MSDLQTYQNNAKLVKLPHTESIENVRAIIDFVQNFKTTYKENSDINVESFFLPWTRDEISLNDDIVLTQNSGDFFPLGYYKYYNYISTN